MTEQPWTMPPPNIASGKTPTKLVGNNRSTLTTSRYCVVCDKDLMKYTNYNLINNDNFSGRISMVVSCNDHISNYICGPCMTQLKKLENFASKNEKQRSDFQRKYNATRAARLSASGPAASASLQHQVMERMSSDSSPVQYGKITHDMEYHTKALDNLCRICGKKLMKAKEANRYECQPLIVGEHRNEIDAVWGINVLEDTSNCPSKLCHRCGRSIRYVKSGTRTYGRSAKHPNIDWEALQHQENGHCDLCSNYKMIQQGSGSLVKYPSRTLQVTKPSPTPLPYSLLADDIFTEQVFQLPYHAMLDVPPISIELTQRTELKSLYTCSFCLCIVTKPVASPCHHNFCSECLTKYFQFHKSCSVSCPICSSIFSFQEVRCSPFYITVSLPYLPVECSSCGANGELHKLVDHKCPSKQRIVTPSCQNTSINTNLSRTPVNNEQSTYQAVNSGRERVIKYINPLQCKYCKRTFHDGLRYRIHVHRHERRIKPYWYRRKQIPQTQGPESVTFVLVNQ